MKASKSFLTSILNSSENDYRCRTLLLDSDENYFDDLKKITGLKKYFDNWYNFRYN